MGANLKRIRELKQAKKPPGDQTVATLEPVVAVPDKTKQGVKTFYECGHPFNPATHCPPCAAAHRKAKMDRDRVKRKAKRSKFLERARLPEGAEFNTIYDAAAESWTGSLKIEGCPLFETKCGGVFGVLTRLDDLYRAWLKREEVEKKEETAKSA